MTTLSTMLRPMATTSSRWNLRPVTTSHFLTLRLDARLGLPPILIRRHQIHRRQDQPKAVTTVSQALNRYRPVESARCASSAPYTDVNSVWSAAVQSGNRRVMAMAISRRASARGTDATASTSELSPSMDGVCSSVSNHMTGSRVSPVANTRFHWMTSGPDVRPLPERSIG